MNAIVPIAATGGDVEYRRSTDAAGLCGEIVKKTAKPIQGRKYVPVEGWQAIAIAHGCAASARDVERIDGGVRAIGEVRRMCDGQVIAIAEGFVGEDEPTWYGGRSGNKTLPKRAYYAIRAMAQTRAISRACRSAFAHVVVMIDAGLSTTPAEEVPDGGFVDAEYTEAPRQQQRQQRPRSDTRKQDEPQGMPDAEWAKLSQLLQATGTAASVLRNHYKVQNLRLLNQQQYADAIERLNADLASKARAETDQRAQQGNQQTGAGFGIDDDIAF